MAVRSRVGRSPKLLRESRGREGRAGEVGCGRQRHTERMANTPGQVPLPSSLQHVRRDSRGYPLIFTVSLSGTGASLDTSFSVRSECRQLVLAALTSAVRGSPLTGTARHRVTLAAALGQGVGQESVYLFGEAPVHRMCVLHSAQVCPLVASPTGGMSTRPVHARDQRVTGPARRNGSA